MTKLQELIKDLPDELKPFANSVLPILVDWGQAKALQWLNDLMYGSYGAARKELYRAMTPAQRDEEDQRQIDALKVLNNDNAAMVASQRQAVLRIFLKLLSK